MEGNKLKIISFLNRFFRKSNLNDDDDIFQLGYVNSLFAMQLVMFLEKEFNITIDNDDLDLSNFNTINAILSFIDRKKL